jgi:hypothetical protein
MKEICADRLLLLVRYGIQFGSLATNIQNSSDTDGFNQEQMKMRIRTIRWATALALMLTLAIWICGFAAVAAPQIAHGPTFPPNPWDGKIAHGPTFPPNPWDGKVAHGPTFPPNPWDGKTA